MRELQRKQRMKQVLYSWPVLVLVAVLTFFLAKGAAGVMVKERESADMVGKLEAEKREIESREAELREGIARLQTEEGIIEEIRAKFGVTREGEYMAVIVDEKAGGNTEKTDVSWYERIWDAIIKKQ